MTDFVDVFISIANLLNVFNSAANFLVYMLKGKKFRAQFRQTYFINNTCCTSIPDKQGSPGSAQGIGTTKAGGRGDGAGRGGGATISRNATVTTALVAVPQLMRPLPPPPAPPSSSLDKRSSARDLSKKRVDSFDMTITTTSSVMVKPHLVLAEGVDSRGLSGASSELI